MAKNSIRDFSATSSSNTDIQSVDIDENCAASGINNAIRELMADLKDVSTGTVNLETPAADRLDVDNIRIDGNTISSTDTNGDITLDPDGTGDAIIASGNLGVGQSTTRGKLTVKTANATSSDSDFDVIGLASETSLAASNKTATLLAAYDTANFGAAIGYSYVSPGYNLIFGTNDNTSGNPIERMRIDSSGNVGINATSGGARLHVEDETNDQVAFFHNTNSGFSSTNVQISTSRNTTGGAYNHLACSIHGVSTTFIVYDGGNVVNSNNSYGQISDQRLKENIADASSQWDDIKALQVRNFNFIGDDLNQIGVVAQEVEAAGMNGLIQEAAWFNAASNPDSEVRKTVKYSVLYMKAVKALQEAMTRIETLETKVAALEAAE